MSSWFSSSWRARRIASPSNLAEPATERITTVAQEDYRASGLVPRCTAVIRALSGPDDRSCLVLSVGAGAGDGFG